MNVQEITLTDQEYDQLIEQRYAEIEAAMPELSPTEQKTLRHAFEYAYDAHKGVRRKSGEPYILHPLAVAHIVVSEMGLIDPTAVICAFLHDVVEDTAIELSDIQREFGNEARHIIDGLTKMSGSVIIDEMDAIQAENFRKILLTISSDVRVIIIKIGDRLHNMRTLGAKRRESMLKVASETLYIYAPVAHRLGLYEIKTELEDLAFKYSQPATYQELETKLDASKDEARAYIEHFVQELEGHLHHATPNLTFEIKSRYKSVYSIYNKMQRKNLPFERVFDKYAVRIIIDPGEDASLEKEKADCWMVYALISELYRANPTRLRDWVTVAKDNRYESLHTTLQGPGNQWVEVQIRTQRMDKIAEQGIAAHWKYKEDGQSEDPGLTDWISQIRELLENPSLNALEAVRAFKENLLQPNDVFVFSPKGEMIRLPQNASVLDFAYKIHTSIGHSAIGAKVNNNVVNLDHRLSPGDQVEILTSRKGKPVKDWLRYVITPRARDQVKLALRKERKEIVEQGRLMFQWKARQYEVDEYHPYMNELLAYFMMPSVDDFFYALGTHRINTAKIPEFIQLKKEGREIDSKYIRDWEERQRIRAQRFQEFGVEPDRLILGAEEVIERHVLASCCNPLPGDDIIGFHEGNRIVIHQVACQEAISMMSNHGSHIVKAKWADDGKSDVKFLAALKVVGIDKQGMLNDLLRIISLRLKLNLRKVSIESHEGLFEGLFQVYVHSIDDITQVMSHMRELPNVYAVSRYDGGNGQQEEER